MNFEEAKTLARKGIKVKHEYFVDDEYMIMQGNLCIFEDGCKMFVNEWSEGKPYLLEGWSLFLD